MRQAVLLTALVAAISGGVIGWIVWPQAPAESQVTVDPDAVSPVLQQLGPGTALHTVTIVYRRHGPVESQIPKDRRYLPEWTRNETWAVFDGGGVLASYRGETRGLDGILYGTAALDGQDLVSRDAVGQEVHRIRGFASRLPLDTLRDKISAATTRSAAAVSAAGVAPVEADGRRVYVLETRRVVEPPRGLPPPGAIGYSLPYVGDLDPAEEVRRSYVLADEFRGVKSEVVIVSRDAAETVVESHEHQVFEAVLGE